MVALVAAGEEVEDVVDSHVAAEGEAGEEVLMEAAVEVAASAGVAAD